MSPNSPYRVLVVDDEERIRQAVRRVLEAMGMVVFEAANGREGLTQIGLDKPDLVLVDLMMPIMDGMEMIGRARKDYAALAFVVITGYATLEKAVEAMKQGADDFLAKPFKPQELRLVVERVLKRVATLQDMAIEKSRTRVLVEAMSNGVLVVDDLGKVVLMNPALRRLVHWDEGDVLGRDLADVLPCAEVARAMGEVLAGHNGQSQSVACQVTMGTAEKPIHLQVTCSPFPDGRGRLVGALAVFDDVTALRHLDELKSEYVSTVAHEIASPLASVLSQLQNLSQGLAGGLNERQMQILQRARLRIDGIVSLSKDLLDLSKIEAGAMGQAEEHLDIGSILEESVDILRVKAAEKGQTMELEVTTGLPQVAGVPRELQEVFVNLVSNAVRYTPAGGQIKVWAGAENGWVRVDVSDNGFGVPPEDQEKIFQRFYRVKDANTRNIVGTGLGLPIVKRVVESLGGSIRLRSKPGQGSTFSVRLPAAG